MVYRFPHLNRDEAARDTLIFGKHDPNAYRSGGVRYFDGLSLATLQRLFAQKFIDADDKQNYAPTAGQILEFMERYPEYTAHGYTVTIDRPDYRVTLEGVCKGDGADSMGELEDFINLFRDADTIDTATMSCWFD